MSLFVASNRRAGKFGLESQRDSRDCFDAAFDRIVARSSHKLEDVAPLLREARRVVYFECDAAEMALMRSRLPDDMLIEPLIRHQRPHVALRGFPKTPFVRAASQDGSVDVSVADDRQKPIRARVDLVLTMTSGASQGDPVTLTLFTDDAGECSFRYDALSLSPGMVMCFPNADHWSMVSLQPKSEVRFHCPPFSAQAYPAWWHRAIGLDPESADRGDGIKVGVIDSGCGPNRLLSHVSDLGSIVQGSHDARGGIDSGRHGSLICGIIGGTPKESPVLARVGGVACEAEMLSLRVFPPFGEANQGDVALALDLLSRDHRADVINMSFVSDGPSSIEHDAILDAYERGTVCVCASGNGGVGVAYPAAFKECISVAALGYTGWGPDGSVAAFVQPGEPDAVGRDGLFVAPFSNIGASLTCCAPGVGIISTIPTWHSDGGFGDDSGTSDACAMVAGILANLLSRSVRFRFSPRDKSRAIIAHQLIADACVSIGCSGRFQSLVMPRLALAVK
jgi:hypothetical protein